jgi:hypothetical protein
MWPAPDFYKSIGSYGSGHGDFSFTSKGNDFDYIQISVTLDLKNTHSHSGNRVGVLVYNDDAFTVETVATIDGGGGDICSATYTYTLFRPEWSTQGNDNGKHLRLSIQPAFQDNDAQSNVTAISFIQRAN